MFHFLFKQKKSIFDSNIFMKNNLANKIKWKLFFINKLSFFWGKIENSPPHEGNIYQKRGESKIGFKKKKK